MVGWEHTNFSQEKERREERVGKNMSVQGTTTEPFIPTNQPKIDDHIIHFVAIYRYLFVCIYIYLFLIHIEYIYIDRYIYIFIV